MRPATIPPCLKSFRLIFPVLYAIALGGVDTGKNKAAEALNPMTIVMISISLETNTMAMGINMVVVAVLLIKFENTTVNSEKTTTNI